MARAVILCLAIDNLWPLLKTVVRYELLQSANWITHSPVILTLENIYCDVTAENSYFTCEIYTAQPALKDTIIKQITVYRAHFPHCVKSHVQY